MTDIPIPYFIMLTSGPVPAGNMTHQTLGTTRSYG
jgi:hypothetical protein